MGILKSNSLLWIGNCLLKKYEQLTHSVIKTE